MCSLFDCPRDRSARGQPKAGPSFTNEYAWEVILWLDFTIFYIFRSSSVGALTPLDISIRYPAFFESRLGDGLQMSFIFMQSISQVYSESNQNPQQKGSGKNDHTSSSLTQARLGVSRIYKLIRGNRISRNKFMTSIVRKFDNPTWSGSVISFLM